MESTKKYMTFICIMDVDNNTIIIPILEYKMAHDANIIHSKGINTGSMTVWPDTPRELE